MSVNIKANIDSMIKFTGIDTGSFDKSVILIGSAVGVGIMAGSFYSWIKSGKAGDASLISSRRELLHNKYKYNKVPEDVDVIVIGSGMGGLSCAAILSR
jgi:hypothetical protein